MTYNEMRWRNLESFKSRLANEEEVQREQYDLIETNATEEEYLMKEWS